jgi:YD repeat-containing protein
MIDTRGQTWQSMYNQAGKITKTIAPNGQTTIYTYDASLYLVTLTQQDAATSPTVTRTVTYQYDLYGNVTRQTDPGSRHTDMAYDDTDKLTWRQLPTGEKMQVTYDLYNQPQYQLAYDGSNWITKQTYLYDGDKNLTRQTDADGNVVTDETYDIYNRLSRVTDALGTNPNETAKTSDSIFGQRPPPSNRTSIRAATPPIR